MASYPVAVRPEAREDYPAVHDLIRRAFGREGEARLVEALRKSPGFIPDLSLVAETDGRVVGHILFSPVRTIGGDMVLALAPVAVEPSLQRQGIGSALVLQGLAACRRLGYGVVIVVGHPGYYPRFGFVPAREKGFAAPFPVPDEAFMMLELRPGAAETVGGLVLYPPVFELCDEN